MKIFIIFTVFFLLLLVPGDLFGDEPPNWIKNTALWWSEDKVSDDEFINSMEYLIEHNILIIPSTEKKLLTLVISENEWKAKQFTTMLELRKDTIALLADTAEAQVFSQFTNQFENDSYEFDNTFLKQNFFDRFTDFAKLDYQISQLRILDLEGMEKLRINNIDGEFILIPENELQNKNTRYYFSEALKLERNEIYLSKIDLNEEHGEIEIPYKPTLRMATQIHTFDDEIIGLLIINYDMSQILDSYISSHGETIIFDEDGIMILHSDKTQLFGTQLGTDRTYYDLNPDIEKIEEMNESWYFDDVSKKTIILSETDVHGSERYWHFVHEMKFQ